MVPYIFRSGYSPGPGRQVIYAIRPARPRDTAHAYIHICVYRNNSHVVVL